jgi:methionine-gamma-lyase
MHPGTMPEIFEGRKGPEEGGCFLLKRAVEKVLFSGK